MNRFILGAMTVLAIAGAGVIGFDYVQTNRPDYFTACANRPGELEFATAHPCWDTDRERKPLNIATSVELASIRKKFCKWDDSPVSSYYGGYNPISCYDQITGTTRPPDGPMPKQVAAAVDGWRNHWDSAEEQPMEPECTAPDGGACDMPESGGPLPKA